LSSTVKSRDTQGGGGWGSSQNIAKEALGGEELGEVCLYHVEDIVENCRPSSETFLLSLSYPS